MPTDRLPMRRSRRARKPLAARSPTLRSNHRAVTHGVCRSADMATHDVVVIGGSSGGIEALTAIPAGLPADFPAAVFVVLHAPPEWPRQLPAIPNPAGPPPAR